MPKDARYYWRAEGGFQKAPESPPAPAPPPPHPVTYLPLTGAIAQPMYCSPWTCPVPTGWLPAPAPIGGLCSPPPPFGPPALAPCECSPPPAPPTKDKKKEKKKDDADDDKKVAKKSNPYAPPKLKKGENYLFPREHTTVCIFQKAAPIWKDKYADQKLKFKSYKVSIDFTVKNVMECLLIKGGIADCKGWAMTEVVERGDGNWDKGTTIEYDSGTSNGSLKSMGWSSKRGETLPEVWLVVHKVDFKK